MKNKENLITDKNVEESTKINKNWKYYLGMSLFIFCWIPYIVSGLLLFYKIPHGDLVGLMTLLIASSEISFAISIVLLGKTFVKMLKTKILGIFFRHKSVKPGKPVSKARHYFGVILLFLSFIPSFAVETFLFFGYPKTDAGHVYMFIALLSGYTMFIVSLFVLGSDFWDRAMKLFRWQDKSKNTA